MLCWTGLTVTSAVTVNRDQQLSCRWSSRPQTWDTKRPSVAPVTVDTRLTPCVCVFAACLFRYNLLSLVYFLYLLLLPWFLCPNKHTIRGRTRCPPAAPEPSRRVKTGLLSGVQLPAAHRLLIRSVLMRTGDKTRFHDVLRPVSGDRIRHF